MLQDCHLLWLPFQAVRTEIFTMQGRLAIHMTRFWALPISLATTLGISIDFFSCEY